MTLRNRLIAAFLASTLLPLAATVWITTSLLDRSLRYATTGELDRLSRTLETTAKQFYQRERDSLKEDVQAGRTRPTTYAAVNAAAWPESVRLFWESREAERFGVSGATGERIEYLRRIDSSGEEPRVEMYSRDLGGVSLLQLSSQLRETRELINALDARDLRRGFTLTLLLLLGAVWFASLVPLVVIAHRVSRPIQQLTAALSDFAGGDWSRRLETGRKAGTRSRDEVGRAVDAFNHMADQLEDSRDRLVHLTRMASWQSLARKTAHELKNSLTPIRLTVEEMQARQLAPSERTRSVRAEAVVPSDCTSPRVEGLAPSERTRSVRAEGVVPSDRTSPRVEGLAPSERTRSVRAEGVVPSDGTSPRVEGLAPSERTRSVRAEAVVPSDRTSPLVEGLASESAFMDQAVQIVISEIESLERRVRAFSEFASEPQVRPANLDINSVISERVALLRPVHPKVIYQLRLDETRPRVHADCDLVNGILTNLLQNAAEAAGPEGAVIVLTRCEHPRVVVEVHDSGPGLSEDVTATLFEPTITFKKHGMGLGLSIAKKNALLSGGDIVVIPGQLGGAAFRVSLPS